jgi:hypothetical protein
MPEISITEEQRERLEVVREDVEAAFVDSYGYIPIEDAIQYLLDTYTPPEERGAVDAYEPIATAEYPQLQRVASEVSEVPGSGIDADEMRGKLLAELGVEEFAARLDATSDADPDGAPTTDADPGPTESPAADTGSEGSTAGTGSSSGSGSATPASSVSSGDTQSGSESKVGTPGSGGSGVSVDAAGDDPLAAVNRVLDEHDDKWRESGGDEPYEVDLPDGTIESARTRDDVRQLLFRHY